MPVGEPVVNPGTVGILEDLVAAAFRVRRSVGQLTGMSELELGTLQMLIEAPSSPSQVARSFDVSTAASTGIIDRLERRGHVERRSHATDRRRTEVHLTASGLREMDEQIQPLVDALTAVDERLSAQERVVVEAFLREAIAAFDRVSGADGSIAPVEQEQRPESGV